MWRAEIDPLLNDPGCCPDVDEIWCIVSRTPPNPCRKVIATGLLGKTAKKIVYARNFAMKYGDGKSC